MNTQASAQASHKIVVVGVMAVVVAIAVTTFAVQSHSYTHVAQAIAPQAPLAESPPVENAVATTAEAPATLAPVAPVAAVVAAPVTPVTPAHKEVVAIKRVTTRTPDSTVSSAVEPKVAVTQHVTAPDTAAPATSSATKPADVAPDLSMTAAAAAVARGIEPVQGAAAAANAPTATPVPGIVTVPAPAVATDPSPQTSITLAASDSDISANVKSEIAVDSSGKYSSIGVVTTNGVVALTGSLASQDDIDHVKLVVASVKDVKSVDTSALRVPAI
jgi:hypothetical protein